MEVDISKIPSSVKNAEIQIWWSNVWDSATETGIDKPAKVNVAGESDTTNPTNSGETDIVYGDANEDGKVNISDAVFIMQSIANPDEFKVKEQGKLNGDVIDSGNGLTNMDALAIQYVEIKTITNEAFPMSAQELDALNK